MTTKFIVTDCEMGGIDLDFSLLEVYFGAFDENFNFNSGNSVHHELTLKIKHDKYIVAADAMAVNKIDLVKHHAQAEYKTEAGKKLYNFLKGHVSQNWFENMCVSTKPIVIGHGVNGDLAHIWKGLLNRETFEQFTSYRRVDTSVLHQTFQVAGIVPMEVTGSLESLAKYYEIPIEGTLHTAKADALLTLRVFQKQNEILKQCSHL